MQALVGELFSVVGAEDAVDGELGAEGAEVAGSEDDGLGREADFGDLAPGRLLHHFASCCVEHFSLARLRFWVVECAAGGVDFLVLVAEASRGGGAGVVC